MALWVSQMVNMSKLSKKCLAFLKRDVLNRAGFPFPPMPRMTPISESGPFTCPCPHTPLSTLKVLFVSPVCLPVPSYWHTLHHKKKNSKTLSTVVSINQPDITGVHEKKCPTLDCHPFSFHVFSVARILTMWMVLFILTGLLAMVGSLIMPGKHAVPWCIARACCRRGIAIYFEIRCTLRKASLLLDSFVVCTNLVKVCSVRCLAKKTQIILYVYIPVSWWSYRCFNYKSTFVANIT